MDMNRRAMLIGTAAIASASRAATPGRKVRAALIGLSHAHAFGKLKALAALSQYGQRLAGSTSQSRRHLRRL